ncbi:MAG: AAA family ATPase, partial [Halohasta sp.]
MSEESGIDLTVRSAEKRDAGRGIARLPDGAMRELGVLSGDTVVIEGSTATVAKVWPGGHAAAAGTILIDADTRSNAGVTVGETVRVKKESVAEARRVTLRPPDELGSADISHDTIETAVERDLRDRPIREGEGVRIERLAGSRFTVVSTEPEGTVRVTESTRVTVRPVQERSDGTSGGRSDASTGQSSTGAASGGSGREDRMG